MIWPPARISSPDRKLWWLVAVVSLFAFSIAAWRLDRPGLYYDEILFVNAALGGKTNDFVIARVLGVPVLLMDYIGALKAWIYAPIFAVFPVDPWSVRLPAIFLGLAGTLFAGLAVREWFGARAAAVALALTLFDPTILTQSRLDWGPDALMFFFRGALLFALAKWTRAPTATHAWWIFACLLAGLFEKLSFIWLAGGALGAVALVHGRLLLGVFRKDRAQGFAWVLSVAVVGAAAVRAIMLSRGMAGEASLPWSERIVQAWGLFRLTWSGGGALEVVIGDGHRFALWFAIPVFGCLAMALTGAGLFFHRHRESAVHWAFIVIFTLITGLLFTLTKGATGPHHSAVLSGLWQLAFVPFLAVLLESPRLRRPALAVLGAGAGGMVLTSILTVRCLVAETPRVNWDEANWRLAEYVAKHPDQRFVMTDWGLGNQVIAATRNSGNFADRWPAFTDPRHAEALVRAEATTGPCHYVPRPAHLATMKATEPNLKAALAAAGLRSEIVLTLRNRKDEPVVLVLLATAPSPPAR